MRPRLARRAPAARLLLLAVAWLALAVLGTASAAFAQPQVPIDRSVLRSPGGEHARSGAAPAPEPRAKAKRGRRSKQFLRGFAETNFAAPDASARGFWFDQADRANASIARLNVPWRRLTSGMPTDPRDPGDPAYSFEGLDRSVIDAAVRGQEILLTIYDAPEFAEGPNPSSEAPKGTWKPDPGDLGDFAQAVASRYSGEFVSPGGGVLPRVRYLEAWNETNLSDYLTPQYTKKSTFAGDHYRKMVSGFSRGVKRSGSGANVVVGATAPYGDPQGGRRSRPLRFLRDFLCLDGKLKARRKCGPKPRFDVLSHHPITLSGGPNRSAIHRDDAAMPDFKHVVRTLRVAERRNTVRGAKRHRVWATEFWWESNPPDGVQGVPLSKHARWIQRAQYSLWRQGASAAIWLLLVDRPAGPDGHAGQQSGIFFLDRRQKPAFTAFRFPLVLDRASKRKVKAWTIPPASGRVEIQKRRKSGFKTVASRSGTDAKPMTVKVRARGKTKFRAVLGGETSLTAGVK